MSEWQPIETAPKDGTKILMLHKGLINTAWWRLNVFSSDHEWGGSGWSYADFSQPTHWMPLPAPPVNILTNRVTVE